MNLGFKGLDKIINIEEPQLILLTGTHFIEEFSGDIAHNICLKQECNVLEIVGCKIGYILQRMFVNLSDVNYRSWYRRNEYTDEELKTIAIKIEDVIEGPKKFPQIIEQDTLGYDLKKISKLVEHYANHYADREEVNTLVVIDVFPLNQELRMENKRGERYTRESIKLIKDLKKISSKLRCPIIVVYNIDLRKKYNENHKHNYLTKEHIDNIKNINKYVDTFVVANVDETIANANIFDIDVYDRNKKIGTCKLEYNGSCRKFLDYNEGEK